VDRAGDVLDLRFEPREQRGLRVFVAAVWQAVTLADTISGNDASGAGGAYVVTRRSDGSEVVLDTIVGGGHAWPGGARIRPRAQEPSDALDATAEIWAFFSRHELPTTSATATAAVTRTATAAVTRTATAAVTGPRPV